MLFLTLANQLAEALKTTLLHNETASLAVSGGTSPGPVFDALCAAELDWTRVRICPTDERWVPEDHPRSNAQMIRARLLQGRAADAEFLPLYAPAEQPEEVLPDLEAQIAPQLPLSAIMLGMGADMHVASLFPGAPGLADGLAPDAPALVAQRPEPQPETRISLSARAIGGAMSKHLLILGQDKREALEQATTLPPERAPVNAVLLGTTVHWAA